MSPALRKASPRVTSAAISAADRRWLGGDSVGGGELVRDAAGAAAGSSAGASEMTGDGASATCGSGATTAGGKVAGRVVDSSTGESIASGGVGDGIASGFAIATISG